MVKVEFGLTPSNVRQLLLSFDNIEFVIEHDAGKASGFHNDEYSVLGSAVKVTNQNEVWKSDVIC